MASADGEAAALRRELRELRGAKDARIDELQQELVEVLKELEEKEEEVDRLRADENRASFTRRGTGDTDSLDTDTAKLLERLDRAEEDVEQQRATALRSKETLKERELEVEQLKVELAEERIKNDSLQMELEKAEQAQQRAVEERKRAEKIAAKAHEEQRDHRHDRTSLLSEQQQLREEKAALQTQLEAERTTQEEMLELLDDLNNDKDQLVTANADLERELEEMREELQEATRDRDELRTKVHEESEVAEEHDSRQRAVEDQLRSRIGALETEVREARAETTSLEGKLATLKEQSGVGQLERDLETTRVAAQRNESERDDMERRLEQALGDLEAMAEALDAANEATEERVYSMVAQERVDYQKTVKKVEHLEKRLKEEIGRREETEKAKARVDSELLEAQTQVIDLATEKGMMEVVKGQMVLKKRLLKAEEEHEKLIEKYSELRDDRDILVETCRRLKQEAGRAEDFWYPEMEIREAIASALASMKAKIIEQEKQIEHLEAEQHRLLKALRDNAAVIGEKGIKFTGLEPAQLLQVNEFAANLRDGKVLLPLDDQSRLLQEKVVALEQKLETERRVAGENHLRLELQVQALQSSEPTVARLPFGAALSAQKEVASMVKDLRELMDKQLQQTNSAREAHLAQGSVAEESNGDELSAAPSPDSASRASRHPWLKTLLDEHATGQQAQMDRLLEMNERLMAKIEEQEAASLDVRNVDSWLPGLRAPVTEPGKGLLRRQIHNLSLPPDDWADDFKAVTGQLVEALEQLEEREREVDAHAALLRRYEESVMQMKAQMGVAYHKYAEHVSDAEKKQSDLSKRVAQLEEEKDKCAIKASKFEKLCEQLEQEPSDIQQHLKEQTRRCTILEVNEAVLARRYRSLESQLAQEKQRRKEAETELKEATIIWRHRILYLEQWKARAVGEIEVYVARLERSCSKARCEAAEHELKHLRQEHLDLLGREADLRMRLTSSHEMARNLADARRQLDSSEIQKRKAEELLKARDRELELTKETLDTVLTDSVHADTVSRWAKEAARYQGESLRLSTELEALQQELDVARQKLTEAGRTIANRDELCRELEQRSLLATKAMQAARRREEALKHAVGGGLDSARAEELQQTLEDTKLQCSNLQHEVHRQKELAEVATMQAEQADAFQERDNMELEQLRQAIVDLEQQSDDGVIIGKLQRQIFGLRARVFELERSHGLLRSQLRKREAMARVLDARLEVREDAFAKYRDEATKAREELESALRKLTSGAGALDDELSPLSRARDMSKQMRELTEMSERKDAELRAAKAQREEMRLEIDKLQCERSELEALVEKLRSTVTGDKPTDMARQMCDVTNAVRQSKLLALEAQREASNLREEKRLLQHRLHRQEQNVSELEEKLAEAKTESILNQVQLQGAADPGLPPPGYVDGSEGAPSPRSATTALTSTLLQPMTNLDGIAAVELERARRHLEHDLKKQILDAASAKSESSSAAATLSAQHKDIAALQARVNHLRSELEKTQSDRDGLGQHLQELQLKVRYYEALAVENSLPLAPRTRPESSADAAEDSSPALAASQKRRNYELQDVAHTTITSLRRLIEDKNRTIRGYQQKISVLQREKRQAHKVGRAEFRAAAEHQYEADAQRIEELRKLVRRLETECGTGSGAGVVTARLIQQIEEVQGILAEKDREARELESKLTVERKKTDRAEARAGELVTEMTKMKADMLLLAQQVQQAEERTMQALDDRASKKKLGILQKRLAAREAKMRDLRLGMVRLKQEFLREQERADARTETAVKEKFDRAQRRDDNVRDELQALRDTIEKLQKAVGRAKETAEKNGAKAEDAERSAREEGEENRRLTIDLEKRERQLSSLDAELVEANRELEVLRRRERKLLSKLRQARVRLDDDADDDANTGDGENSGEDDGGGGRSMGDRNVAEEKDAKASRGRERRKSLQAEVEEARRRIMLLEAQNEALQSAVKFAKSGPGALESQPKPAGTAPRPEAGGALAQQSTAYRDEIRSLKRRQKTLTDRLEAQQRDLEAAEGALSQARAQTQELRRERDTLLHRVNNLHDDSTRQRSRGDDLEALRQRYFQLEQDVEQLRREKAALESQDLTLRREAAAAREEQAEAASSARRLQRQMDELLGGGDVSELRKSESRFSQLAQARETIESLNKRLQDAESKILEGEAKSMELQFEVSAATTRNERFSRRISELEEAVRQSEVATAEGSTLARKPGGRFKRERDLEGVVDALKRVVDKLKSENDRLRRGAAESTKVNEAERRAREARKKAQELQAELTGLRTRAAAGEEASQRLASKTEQLAQLRRALKRRDGELKSLREKVDEVERTKVSLEEVANMANRRVVQLEAQVGSTSARPAGRSGQDVERLRRRITQLEGERDAAQEAAKAAAASAGRLIPSSIALPAEDEQKKALERELEEERRLRRSLESRVNEGAALAAENRQLRRQTEKMAKELAAFDLDFFEEIENLKYEHAEALKRLARYEGSRGGPG